MVAPPGICRHHVWASALKPVAVVAPSIRDLPPASPCSSWSRSSYAHTGFTSSRPGLPRSICRATFASGERRIKPAAGEVVVDVGEEGDRQEHGDGVHRGDPIPSAFHCSRRRVIRAGNHTGRVVLCWVFLFFLARKIINRQPIENEHVEQPRSSIS